MSETKRWIRISMIDSPGAQPGTEAVGATPLGLLGRTSVGDLTLAQMYLLTDPTAFR